MTPAEVSNIIRATNDLTRAIKDTTRVLAALNENLVVVAKIMVQLEAETRDEDRNAT